MVPKVGGANIPICKTGLGRKCYVNSSEEMITLDANVTCRSLHKNTRRDPV